MSLYLVWSNEASAWWLPNGAGYTQDVWCAGRYDEAEAQKACGMRTWSVGKPPPEVMVIAPEVGKLGGFNAEDIRRVPQMMRDRIAAETNARIATRQSEAAS